MNASQPNPATPAQSAGTQSNPPSPYLTPKDLLAFDAKNDPNQMLGNRWLTRSSFLLLVGPSGIGKSVFAVMFAVFLAAGRRLFGIKVRRPMKSLFIQSENDDGDMAEALQGVLKGASFRGMSRKKLASVIQDNLVFVRETGKSGTEFAKFVREQIAYHKPDIVWVDPLLAFLGCDACDQKGVSDFLRHQLLPISEETGIIWVVVHHTGKPDKESGARAKWTSIDHAYSGLGSSELTNCPRAICVFSTSKAEDGSTNFYLNFAKRGKRAGAIHPDGTPTVIINLQQSERGIFWRQVDPPDTPPRPNPPHPSPYPPLLAGLPSPVRYSTLVSYIMQKSGITQSAAKTKVTRIVKAGFLQGSGTGIYTHPFGPKSQPGQSNLPI